MWSFVQAIIFGTGFTSRSAVKKTEYVFQYKICQRGFQEWIEERATGCAGPTLKGFGYGQHSSCAATNRINHKCIAQLHSS